MMSACTLPERQENDWFDSKELPDRIIWTQQFPGGEIKQEQSVEGETDRHIVDQGDVQEARGRPTNSQSGQVQRIHTLLLYSPVYSNVLQIQYWIKGKIKLNSSLFK